VLTTGGKDGSLVLTTIRGFHSLIPSTNPTHNGSLTMDAYNGSLELPMARWSVRCFWEKNILSKPRPLTTGR
ncbi:hypothetical protein HAX54_001430, partial [Datura stramonium]|nr:hypothetical protein [Datura stramonium]